MDLKKINTWMTLLANFGVLAGIIFLAVEIRQNSDAIRAQTRAQLAEEVTELFSVNMNDQEYATVLMKGNNVEELSPVEQYQYYRHRSAWSNHWLNVAYQHKMGMYDDSEFELQINNIQSDMKTFPGLKVHWCTWRHRSSPELIEAVEGELSGSYCAEIE